MKEKKTKKMKEKKKKEEEKKNKELMMMMMSEKLAKEMKLSTAYELKTFRSPVTCFERREMFPYENTYIGGGNVRQVAIEVKEDKWEEKGKE
ncbi:hypothetical protein M8J75_002856 [Diaphorina citri]|nr:hypothetical protein M8J75_002856 [Diaphorina citri]KAI5727718.1 hypothetical protein M8J77_005990 [Diaphorina citri]